MGLDTTHDAFNGAYSSFNRFRQIIAKAMGGSYPPHEDRRFPDDLFYWGDAYSAESHPGLYIFLTHSDCDGEISAKGCKLVADDLEKLLPKIEALGGDVIGHLARVGTYADVTRKFIAGCRLAYENNEPLEFL